MRFLFPAFYGSFLVVLHPLAARAGMSERPGIRWYAKRVWSHTVEVEAASHVVYVSHPKEVADLIEFLAIE